MSGFFESKLTLVYVFQYITQNMFEKTILEEP